MSDLHPIISARFSDHVDTLSATYEVMGVIEAMAERCKAAHKHQAIKFYFVVMVDPPQILSI